MFFAADGRRSPTSRQKPDITAADGVCTSLARLRAVLRHVGGGAARGRDRRPRAVGQPGRAARPSSARRSTRPRSTSRRRASTAAPATASCAPTACSPTRAPRRSRWSGPAAPTVTPVTGDGDAYLEPGETATVTLPVTNAGDGTATGVSVTAATGDPRAPLTPRAQSYGDLAAGATESRDFSSRWRPTTRSASASRCRCGSRSRARCHRRRRRSRSRPVSPRPRRRRSRMPGRRSRSPTRATSGASVTIPVTRRRLRVEG